jgi:hypothetical protein
MIVKAFNDAVVFYQTPIYEDRTANAAILIHRDNGDSLVLSQEGAEIVLDLHRGNVKEFIKALDSLVAVSEARARKGDKK